MHIEFTGRQMEVTLGLRAYTEEHFGKIQRLLRDRCAAKVILTAERHLRVAEVTLTFRDHMLVGIGETPDARQSINDAMDKLERQVVRLMERRRTSQRRPQPAQAARLNTLQGTRANHEDRGVVETELVPIKPLSVEEAIEALTTSRSGAVVFRNQETERVNVVYRRPDGNLGLIEPEP